MVGSDFRKRQKYYPIKNLFFLIMEFRSNREILKIGSFRISGRSDYKKPRLL